MSPHALVLTYHAIERGTGPLYVDVDVFAAHLDAIVDSAAEAVTVSQLAAALRDGSLRGPTVAITFDDGIASVAHAAAPLLAERGLPATIFCVAGSLGGCNDWPTGAPGAPRFELAGQGELAALAATGFEIGCHGMTHAPVVSGSAPFLERELVEARAALEHAVSAPVRTYAYPYGAPPAAAAARIVEATYDAACTTALGYVERGAPRFSLPRVDAHYVRRPEQVARALDGSLRPYLAVRRLGARARRVVRSDYRAHAGA